MSWTPSPLGITTALLAARGPGAFTQLCTASATPPIIAISSRSTVKTPLTNRNSPEERPGSRL